MRRSVWLLAWTALLGAPLPRAAAEAPDARAAESKPATDDIDLLEFLGSNDDIDADLQDYLAQPMSAPPRGTEDGLWFRSAGS